MNSINATHFYYVNFSKFEWRNRIFEYSLCWGEFNVFDLNHSEVGAVCHIAMKFVHLYMCTVPIMLTSFTMLNKCFVKSNEIDNFSNVFLRLNR